VEETKRKFRFGGWVLLFIGLLVGGVATLTAVRVSSPQYERAISKETPVMSGMKVAPSQGARMTGQAFAPDGKGEGGERLVIKRKTLRLEVNDVRAACAEVEKVAARYGGFIVNSVISSPGGEPVRPQRGVPEAENRPLSGTVVVKVPVERFAAAVKEMKSLGKLRSEEETSEEVTEQHIDLTARLRNLKRQEERYLEILKSATKVEEMLKVEEQLVRIRGEIESLQAQVEYLEKSAAMAVVTLELFEPASVATPLVSWGVKEAFITALRGFVTVINFFIIAAGTVLPLVLAGLLVWLGVVVYKRRQRGSG